MNRGIYYALAGYGIWGILPIYWKLLGTVPAMQVMAHRMCWSLILMLLVLWVKRDWGWVWELKRKQVVAFFAVSLLIAFNWYLYIWAVQSNFIVEASLGYFMNPLINVLLGFIFLAERPRPLQWVAIGLAVLGVVYLTLANGKPPWISLALATSFSVYGLLKKLAPLGPIRGMALEISIMFLPALVFLIFQETSGVGSFGHGEFVTNLLLVFSGVATMIPLLCYAAAARTLTLTQIGLLQYLSPTLQFLVGVLLFKEHTSPQQYVAFAFIWGGLALFTWSSLRRKRYSSR